MVYSENKIKVYTNKILLIKQETYLKILEDEYNELCDIIKLFSEKTSQERLIKYKEKKDMIDKKHRPQIKEARRILTNTRKRFTYNLERSK